MKAALLIVLSLSAVALAGPAINKNNQINSPTESIYSKQQDLSSQAKGPIVDVLKQWCASSQMSQQELTSSFKKLVSVIKSKPIDQSTEQAVMNERVCSAETSNTDAQAHELVKDVYMDALIACKSRDCNQQLLKIIKEQSNKVDTIRASYYMTRLAVTEKDQLKSTDEIKQLVESFIQDRQNSIMSESVERQQLFAVTSMVGKYCQDKPQDQEAKQIAQQVAKTIVERYVKPVSQQEVEQYQEDDQQCSEQIVKKIAKRNAALKALANLPGHLLKDLPECEQELVSIAQNKQELVTSRQSAIECLEQNEKSEQMLKQITFDQEEPIEIRVTAYRTLMTVAYSPVEDSKQQMKQSASKIIDQVVKHCENSRNQQQDEQFVLYAISHLDNMRTSQQPEHQAIKECIEQNKQHYMQIQVLCKKFKQQLSDVRRSSRNYKLEQEFNQIESGLILEGDIIYENQQKQTGSANVLPKLVRVNMSMPVMGETVNVIEITLRQNQMDEEFLSALKLVTESTKFTNSRSGSVSKIVDSFKSSVEKTQTRNTGSSSDKACEADLTIKIDGCTVVYVSADDFKTSSSSHTGSSRNTRSVKNSSNLVDDIIVYLKRSPINFNRGINFNLNERIAKLLDIEANLIAGLRFESRAQGHSSDEFEIVAKAEPRFNFEAIVGPAKMSSKKLLQRLSTKTAMGLRLRFKRDELVDVQVDLPMQSMELFTVETQIVEKTSSSDNDLNSYSYLPESIYGQEDIYSIPSELERASGVVYSKLNKRSIFESNSASKTKMLKKLIKGNKVSHSFETSEKLARATGLRGKLRFVAAPKDMSLLVSCSIDKYEPSMEGFRVQVQKTSSSQQSNSYLVSVSTPGSRINRQMVLSVSQQSTSQRTLIKSNIQMGDKVSVAYMTEIVHDGRQYSIKTELVSRSQRTDWQWRHFAEAGVMIQGGGSAKSPVSGRFAQIAYKPYVQIVSTSLKRPLELQGTIAYSQSPKSVISYELKCPTSGDYIQGKLIVDQRDVSQRSSQRGGKSLVSRNLSSSQRLRRSMQSPLEMILSKDLTLTNEIVAQVQSHAVKVHNMVDWDAQKIQLEADFTGSYKNMRQSQSIPPATVSCQIKLDTEKQLVVVERKNPQDSRKDCRATISSQWRAPAGHQMSAEIRYQSGSISQRNQIIAYKHKIDIQQLNKKSFEGQMEVELIATEKQINEKVSARARVSTERKQKSVSIDLTTARQQVAKIQAEYESLSQHQVSVYLQTQTVMHKCELRNNQREFVLESRTDKQGQTQAKALVQLVKQAEELKVIVEVPVKRSSVACDIKLASGQQSSIAVKTPRFVSRGEFSFETISRPFFASSSSNKFSSFLPSLWNNNKSANLRFRNQLKDLESKQAYWMDSALNAADWDKETSFFRFESPVYRTDIEFDPRDQSTKFGAFARSKRSIDESLLQESNIYSTKNSALNNFLSSHQSINELAKLGLGQNKLWMLRAMMSSPFAREQLKQQARRALLQYIDAKQSHQHSFEFQPREGQWASFDLDYSPNTEFGSASFEPMRLKADLSSSISRPSTVSFDSQWMSANVDAKPFDLEESYAKVSALSRHRRSPFSKHESEYRHKKDEGHKAWMKHVDSKGKQHELRAESERNPKNWAKISYESDKHGKANWEHKWRQHLQKRSSNSGEEDVYANNVKFEIESPKHGQQQWKHQTDFDWMEPSKMINERRYRRSTIYDDENDHEQVSNKRYSPIEYLKHTSARLSSVYSMPSITGQNEPLYKVDFDYKPQLQSARLNVQMPEDILHQSSVDFKPEERLYKLQSKLYNQRTLDSIYDFSAQTKPFVAGLATANQEPVFVHTDHPMLESPIDSRSLAYNLFKQPMKLDYSDKYGRMASFDYDALPMTSSRYAGLRQKRAAVFFKDSNNDIEHSSSYDFYPETFLGCVKPSYINKNNNNNNMNSDDIVIKTQTKYGPVVVRAETSDVDNMQCVLESPIVNVKLTTETGANMRKLVKVQMDNKSQRVQLAKLLRQSPIESIRNWNLAQKIARKVDSSRFEHETEVLVSLVDAIFKVKSQTELNSRKVVSIEGEWNEKQGKAYAKINGERCDGKLVVDLMRKSAELVLDAESKHGEPVHHQTRLVRTSDNFYTLESITSHKSRPVLKLVGRVSALLVEDPAHLLTSSYSHRRHQSDSAESHISTFEAVYEPKQLQITGFFDCDKKEARIVTKNVPENKVQETLVKFEEQTETILVNSRLSSANEGQVYAVKAKLNLPGLYQSDKCYYKQSSPRSCASELVYEDKSGVWATKYQPNDFILVSTPRGQQSIKLNY